MQVGIHEAVVEAQIRIAQKVAGLMGRAALFGWERRREAALDELQVQKTRQVVAERGRWDRRKRGDVLSLVSAPGDGPQDRLVIAGLALGEVADEHQRLVAEPAGALKEELLDVGRPGA